MRRLLALVLLTSACCPIPWHRRVMLRPEGTVRVIDAVTRSPIAGAEVVVSRYNVGPPPTRVTHRFAARTGSSGEVTFTAATEGEWVMPLMMHGVPQWGVEVCAGAEGHVPVASTWVIQREWSRPARDARSVPMVEIALEPALAGSPAASTSDGCEPGRLFGRSDAGSVRLTVAGPAPSRPGPVPASAQWAAGGSNWIDCAPEGERFRCAIYSEEGLKIVEGTFRLQKLHAAGLESFGNPVWYSFDFSADRVLLRDDRALVPDGYVQYPVIGQRREYDRGRLVDALR